MRDERGGEGPIRRTWHSSNTTVGWSEGRDNVGFEEGELPAFSPSKSCLKYLNLY